jgi:hypothetical protein
MFISDPELDPILEQRKLPCSMNCCRKMSTSFNLRFVLLFSPDRQYVRI